MAESPVSAGLAGGGYVVAWEAYGRDGSGYSVYYQLIDAAGAQVASDVRANTTLSGDQDNPTVTALSTGGFLISWDGDVSGGRAGFAQRFDASGNRVGSEFQISLKAGVTVGALANGGFVSGYLDPSGQYFLLQRFDAAGVRVGFEQPIYTAKLPSKEIITGLPDGGFVVTWQAEDNGTPGASSWDIFSQRFDVNGAAVGAVGQVNSYGPSAQLEPVVTALADGGWVVAWQSYQQHSIYDYNTYFQRYNASGQKIGPETLAGSTGGMNPSIAALTTGGFVLTWFGIPNSVGSLMAQVYDANGAAVGPERTLVTGSYYQWPSVAATADGGFAISWAYNDNYGSDVLTHTASVPITVTALTVSAEAALADAADDVLTMTPTTLNPGDSFDGGAGHDTLKAGVTGTYNFTGVTLTNVETILGSSGDDTFIFAGGVPAGVVFDSGGGHDTAVVSGDIAVVGDWTVAAASGATVTFTLHDTDPVARFEGHGAHVTVDASSIALTAEQRAILFDNGIEKISQPGGVIFTAQGTAQHAGSTTKVSTLTDNVTPAIAPLAGGGYVLTWATEVSEQNWDIHARIFNDAGVAQSPEFTVNSVTDNSQGSPSVAALEGGGFVVTWRIDFGFTGTGNKAQVFDAAGAKVGSEFTVGSPFGQGATGSTVTALDGGGFAIAWSSAPNSPSHVFVNIYDANGAPVGSQIQADNDGFFGHESPAITGLPGGGFAVSWVTPQQQPYQRVFDASGQPVSAGAAINGSDSSAFDIGMVGLKDGTYVISWVQSVNTYPTQLYTQLYHADGTPLGSRFVLADNVNSSYGLGQPVATADGGYFITWRESSHLDYTTRVYAQKFDANGALSGERLLISGLQMDDQPAVTETASGAQVFAWMTSVDYGKTQINQQVLQTLDYHVLTSGADTVGGTDADTLVVGAPGDINAADNLTGGAGTDRLELTQSGVVNLAALAAFSGFEEIVGASGDDTLIVGSTTLAGVTNIDGRTGRDVIQSGSAGTLNLSGVALSGIELIAGTSGVDTITGTSGDDVVAGLGGADAIDGGADSDTADYSASASAVTVNLTTSVNTGGDAQGDTLVSIENLIGSAFDDVLIGDAGFNVLEGGAGNDFLDGKNGGDTVSYASATGGVTVDLSLSTAQNTGGSGIDTVLNVENVIGSAFDDVMTGGSAGNMFDGGEGFDTVSYANATNDVFVNLTVQGGPQATQFGNDTLINIEAVIGSVFNDTLTGNAGNNVLIGGDGDDVLDGRAGDDTLIGGAGVDVATYASAAGAVTVSLANTGAQNTGAAGTDTLTAFENLIGSAFNDTLTGDAGDNVIIGGLGNDILDGGAGTDTVSYAISSGGVLVSLATTTAQNTGGAGTDTLANFENLTGSNNDDVLAGNAGTNVISGGAGGNDTVTYVGAASGVTVSLSVAGQQNTIGDGLDTLVSIENVTGSAFNDVIEGNGGDNILNGGVGIDTVSYASATAGVAVDLWATLLQNTVGAGADILNGFENVVGSGFNDTLYANVGDNVLNGGAGIDTISYERMSAAVHVSLGLAGPQNTLGSGFDTLLSIENLSGSNQDDTLEGNAGDNVIDGRLGLDVVSYANAGAGVTVDLNQTNAQNTGGAGVDTLLNLEGVIGSAFDDLITRRTGVGNYIDGGAGVDTVSYASNTTAVFIDLSSSARQQNTGDILLNVENVIGSNFNDVLWGSSGANVLNGGAGADMVTYSGATAGVTVSLGIAGPQNTGGGGVDTLIGIEALTGSNFADTLSGSAGNDFLDGGAGFDTVSYVAATVGVTVNLSLTGQQNTVGAGVDTLLNFERLIGSDFDDTLTGTDGDDTIEARAGNDTVIGGNGNDILYGGGGDDVLNGGAGNDLANYRDATVGVQVDLRIIGAQNTGWGSDTLIAMDSISGSNFSDVLTGDDNNNSLLGGSGNDVLSAGGGSDSLSGADGFDTLTGGAGADFFRDIAANFNGDTITDFSAGDRIQFTDANLGSFNFALNGSTLTYTGGTMTLANLPGGYHLEKSAASQGVYLALVQNPVLNNGLSGDFNGDGKDDLLWRSDSGQLSNWLGQANGGFVGNDANAFASVPTNWKIIGAGDFNGDGRDDILWRSDAGQMSNWLGTASGGWLGNDANAFVNVPNDWKIAGVGDFNGDGKSDLLWRSDSGLMSDWLGTASGGWAANDANAFTSVPTNWHIIGVGDFNGDHRDDILWRSDSGQMSNWLGQANGGFVGNDANAFVGVPTDWHIVGVGDFNGDGKSDLLWRSDSGLMSNWLGKANGGWTPNDANALTSVPTDWVIAAVGDYNGDGKDDIMWRHTSGAMSNWLGQANGGFIGNDANAYAVVGNSWHIQADNMFGI